MATTKIFKTPPSWDSPASDSDLILQMKGRVLDCLFDEVDMSVLSCLDRKAMVEKLQAIASRVLSEEGITLPMRTQEKIVTDALDDIVGYGVIQSLLDDPDVTEVMVNGPNHIYAERRGKITRSDMVFKNDAEVLRVIEKIVAPLGRRIDEASPMVDARLPDGSRVNAIIPPLALDGPSITIRKFSKDPYGIQDLINFGTLTAEMGEFLRACVEARLNIIVAGGTGSGKTTTLNVLSSFIPESERIVTIEDAAELQLQQEHVVRLETRPPNLEGKGEISIRMLVKNSLRMRPDRIIVGEVRGGEALDMLQAMNTGHDGSLGTVHANTARDTISRMETMTLMSGADLPAKSIKEQIAAAIHLLVVQARVRDGSRKIVNITEVQGMEGEVVVLQDIFEYKQTDVDPQGNVIGKLVATGLRPKFMERLIRLGIDLPANIFNPKS